jgi:TonB family protein
MPLPPPSDARAMPTPWIGARWFPASVSLALHAVALACVAGSLEHRSPAYPADSISVQLVTGSGTQTERAPSAGAPAGTNEVRRPSPRKPKRDTGGVVRGPLPKPSEPERITAAAAPLGTSVPLGEPVASAAEPAPASMGEAERAGEEAGAMRQRSGFADGDLGRGAAPPASPEHAIDQATLQARISAELTRLAPFARRGRVVVRFTLQADGTIGQPQIAHPSGSGSLDELVLKAVLRAAPFPPPGRIATVVVPVQFR